MGHETHRSRPSRFGPGDRVHEGDDKGEAGSASNTGDLPLAASMYRWRVGEPPQTGKPPHRGADA